MILFWRCGIIVAKWLWYLDFKPAFPPPPELPERVLTPRQALFAPGKDLPLDQAEGETAAAPIAPYPPGVPVVAPGERIGKKTIAYLKEIGYNGESLCRVCARRG